MDMRGFIVLIYLVLIFIEIGTKPLQYVIALL